MAGWKLEQQARAIAGGAVFAYPTDTIWGLGCHPMIESAVDRLQKIKQRSSQKGLILLSAKAEYLSTYLTDEALAQLNQRTSSTIQQPITWICPPSRHCPRYLRGRFNSIAVRITNHDPGCRLSHHLKSPLISTSANISGHPHARNSLQIHRHFHSRLDFIIDGFDCGTQQPSQIRKLIDGKIIRH